MQYVKWILIGVGAVILILAIAFVVFLCVSQQNIKDKGGMENPFYSEGVTSSVGEDHTAGTLEK